MIIIFNPIVKGFLEEFGKDLYGQIRQSLAKIAKKQENSEVIFNYTYGKKKVELKVRSSSEKVIASAFDQIPRTIKVIEKSDRVTFYFDFDADNEEWRVIELSGRKIAFPVEGVMATTDRITVRGESIQLTENALRKLAADMAGTPLLYEHSRLPIGVSAHYENGKLMVKGVVYEPRNKHEREIVEQIRTRKLRGLSLGFGY